MKHENIGYRIKSALVALFVLLCIIFLARHSHGHDLPKNVLSCSKFKIDGPWIQVGEVLAENGMIEETYSHIEDGPVQLTTLSMPIDLDVAIEDVGAQTPHFAYPTFYVLDVNGDRVGDIIVVDIGLKGRCPDFEFFNLHNGGFVPERIP